MLVSLLYSVWHPYCILLELSVVFFFFKQTAAYEMRISDWSSDVCSSDLKVLYAGEVEGLREVADSITRPYLFGEIVRRSRAARAPTGAHIGRASWRVRVFQ